MNQRKIKRTQLFRLQELQRKAFDKGLNMEINTRATDTDKPWITGHICEEGTDFVKDEPGTTYIFFNVYNYRPFWTEERNQDTCDEEFRKIENFINNR